MDGGKNSLIKSSYKYQKDTRIPKSYNHEWKKHSRYRSKKQRKLQFQLGNNRQIGENYNADLKKGKRMRELETGPGKRTKQSRLLDICEPTRIFTMIKGTHNATYFKRPLSISTKEHRMKESLVYVATIRSIILKLNFEICNPHDFDNLFYLCDFYEK